jgi:hypothetical protein
VTARADAKAPPDQCGAPIRVQLSGLGAPPSGAGEPSCLSGLKFDGTKCALPRPVVTSHCTTGDVEWCDRNCRLGDGQSCDALGSSYDKGEGTPRDPVRAVAAWRLGCEANEAFGCLRAGEAVRDGRPGLPKDIEAAKALLLRGCELDEEPFMSGMTSFSARSCRELAALELFQIENKPRAIEHYKKACAGKIEEACAAVRALEAPVRAPEYHPAAPAPGAPEYHPPPPPPRR